MTCPHVYSVHMFTLSAAQGYETTCFETLTIPPPVELLQPATREPEPLTEEAAAAGEGAEKEEAGPQLPRTTATGTRYGRQGRTGAAETADTWEALMKVHMHVAKDR